MRLHYYRFPEGTSEDILLGNGCAIILLGGDEVYSDHIPDDKRCFVDHVDDTLSGISIRHAKELLRKYGGSAWTKHCERDGGCFEVSEICLSGNNSHFTYNHHL